MKIGKKMYDFLAGLPWHKEICPKMKIKINKYMLSAILGICAYLILAILELLRRFCCEGYFNAVGNVGSTILSSVGWALLIACFLVAPGLRAMVRGLGVVGGSLILSCGWVFFWLACIKHYNGFIICEPIFLLGSILVAVSFSTIRMQIPAWTARIGAAGLWGFVLLPVIVLVLNRYPLMDEQSEHIVVLNAIVFWVRIVASLAAACGFWGFKFRSDKELDVSSKIARVTNKGFLWWFANSLFVLGAVTLIFDLVCAAPFEDYWNKYPWDGELAVQGIWTLVGCALLGFFIHSQIRVKESFDRANVKPRESGPICLAIAGLLCYIACVLCVIGVCCALVNDYGFRDGMKDSLVRYMSLSVFNQLSRVKEVMNLRFYVICCFVLFAWYSFGLARLMSLMRHNSAKAYSLSGSEKRA